MNEQQRVFLAVVLSLGILLTWQFFFAPSPPSEAPPAPAPTAQPAAPAPGGAIEQAPAASPTATPTTVPAEVRTIETPLYRGALSNRLALTRFELTQYDESVEVDGKEKEQRVSLATAKLGGESRQALVTWSIASDPSPAHAFTDEGLVLRGASASGVTTQVSVEPREDQYVLVYTLRAKNESDRPLPVGAAVKLGLEHRGEQGGMFTPPADVVNGLCYVADEVERQGLGDVDEQAFTTELPAGWAGIDRQYFVVAVVPQGGAAGRCTISGQERTLWVELAFPQEELAPGASWERSFNLFAGPKRAEQLVAAGPTLPEAVDYNLWGIPLGFLARPMVFILNTFHGWSGSWGLAIILLTVLVKTLLFPVTYRSVVSMRRMQELKPELDRLRTQYANDRERQQLEQMKLFRERGVNPLGGCLPMLLQMPVWFALYRTLWTAVDLYHQSFLWIDNLTAPESFPFMAIGVGGLTFLQQRMTPMSVDQQHMKTMMYIMPVVFSVFLIALPSGLVLYILVNSILTIVQQLAINRRRAS